jgi:hypothetical protein
MEPPIYDPQVCSPASGVTCRVWLADGSQQVATMFLGRWIGEAGSADVQPVRWQRLVPRHSTCGWPGMYLEVPGPIPKGPRDE